MPGASVDSEARGWASGLGSWLEMRTGEPQLDTGLRALSLEELTKGFPGQLDGAMAQALSPGVLGHSDTAEQKGSWLWSLRRVGRDTPPQVPHGPGSHV